MAHATVPKFGDWENGQDVPYTQHFETARKTARKGKNGGKMINPNDSQDNMTAYTDNTRPIQSPPSRNGMESDARVREGAPKPRHNQQLNIPVPRDNSGCKTNIEHKRNVSSGETQKRAVRQTGGNQGLAPNKPIRSRGPVTREDETQDKSADVPKLGEWDESNPADNGFTGIFGKLSKEKRRESANVISMPGDVSSFSDHNRANSSANVKFTCFSWGKR